MANVRLLDIAYGRSGDKGTGSNVGIFVKSEALYNYLEANLTTAVVKEHFREICKGEVTRYELPNLKALNFILEDSLSGGGSGTLITDAQGKTHGMGLLQMRMDVPDELLEA
jgi:hypothetical protein